MVAEGRTYEELRAAYLARRLKVDYGALLSAIRRWNGFTRDEKLAAVRKVKRGRLDG